MLAEKRLPAMSPAEPKPAPPVDGALLFVALLVLALGFQVHFALNAAARYVQFAPREQLPYLMPVFWIGFSLLMLPASRLAKRVGAIPLMAAAAAAGAVASLAAALSPGLKALLVAQFIAGGCWGAICVGAYTAVVAFGRRGREGALLGTLFAVLAVGTFARIGASASGLAAGPGFRPLAPWLPMVLWALAAALALAAGRSIMQQARPGGG